MSLFVIMRRFPYLLSHLLLHWLASRGVRTVGQGFKSVAKACVLFESRGGGGAAGGVLRVPDRPRLSAPPDCILETCEAPNASFLPVTSRQRGARGRSRCFGVAGGVQGGGGGGRGAVRGEEMGRKWRIRVRGRAGK